MTRALRRRTMAAVLVCVAALGGCGHKKEGPSKYVYVTAKEATLRDRVAAVSNRTGTVTNGEKLQVLERARRFVKVKSPEGSVGWIEEKLTADQAVADQFDELKQAHAKDAVVANAVARDDVYLHIAPGRETEHFFRLVEGEGMSLLARATVAKALPPGSAPAAAKAAPRGGPLSGAPRVTAKKVAAPSAMAVATPVEPVMEDWWLVRDSKGQVGWIYSRMIDVTEPDALTRYSEGQRIVGAYVLTEVDDPESNMVSNGQPVTRIPEYVTVLSPYKAGLPYDFDQVRVFTWNIKKHRYETSFRERNIEGYLPVKIFRSKDPYGKLALAQEELPAFSYAVLAADAPTPAPDAQTGLVKPGKTVTKTYRLVQTICQRILPPGQPPPEEAHPVPVEKKEAKAKGKRRR